MVLWALAYLAPIHTVVAPTFTNQWPPVLGWGLALSAATVATARLPSLGTAWLAVAVGALLTLLAALARQPLAAAVLLAATATLLFGASVTDADWFGALLLMLLVAGLLNLPLAALQVWTDPSTRASWIPWNPKAAGRAVGFVGQPNLLATLMVWSLVALMTLASRRNWPPLLAVPLAAALGLGLQLTGSRTGLLELAAVGLWAWRSRCLTRPVRQLVLYAAAGGLLGLTVTWAASQLGGAVFYPTERAASHSDISSSRIWIWHDTLLILRDHWLSGVGWGNFNFAWSFTEIPRRHPAHFDHTHNLLLQFAVELGVPATLALLAALAWMARTARLKLERADGDELLLGQCAGLMLAVIGIHSMLEYPLWYTFFLLPSAFWLGWLLRSPSAAEASNPTTPGGPAAGTALIQALGVLTVLGSLYIAWEFTTMLRIYQTFGAGHAQPMDKLIADAQKTHFFGGMGDYAAIVTADKPLTTMDPFYRPLHYLVDSYLLVAYAKAYAARGEIDKARYIVQRVREFKHPSSEEFLGACAAGHTAAPSAPLPFQCELPKTSFRYEDFLIPPTRF